jgi:3,4-dihydroxy 2-butanone 4-phosphate synthase/GTP cyclohydrolase II
MSKANGTRHETAFTVSIEAKRGVTTGISAADRARTIMTAIDAANGPDDIVSPGHVFPLAARDGGVLVRAGHTEAAVDVARLAGLNPSGVICEIMNEDGSMARLNDLVAFGEVHNLRIGTIRDLIKHRRLHDRVVEKAAEMPFDSEWGDGWRAVVFWDKVSRSENLAIIKGEIDPSRPTLVRMHQLSILSDIFGGKSERRGLLEGAMRQIDAAGSGVIVVVNRHDPNTMKKIIKAREAGTQMDILVELRDYGIGAQILAELGVQEMILLTNSHHTLVALEGYGLSIVGERKIAV